MKPPLAMRVETALEAAHDLEPPGRLALLELLGTEDPEVAQELARRLAELEAGAPEGAALPPTRAEPRPGSSAAAFGPTALPGMMVGPWRLVEPIGSGGMGIVFRAERADGAYQRVVALKLLNQGFADARALERFRIEQRILASLEHPGIARLYDAGVTDEGRPWIAMELVEGADILAHCQDAGLDVEARARLVERVCHAVRYAHAQGVVHRDLKPSNILVTQGQDGDVRPVVVDFGIARAVGEPGATLTGHLVGTPAYMSPEQARGEEVDRRTDVYALGAVLYHLLGGAPPFSGTTGLQLVVRVLQEEPVPLRRVAPRVPRDLETITMKCLEKVPDRRYPSTRALADDLRRYLEGEPVAARPSSLLERLGRRARQHPAVAALIVAIVFGLPAGGLKYTLDLRAERGRALAARADAEEVLEFLLQDVYQGLQPLGRLDLLEQVAMKSLDYYQQVPPSELAADALRRRATTLRHVGVVLATQGQWEHALPLYRELSALAAEMARTEPGDPFWHLEAIRCSWLIGEALEARGDIEPAREAYDRAVAEARAAVSRWPEDPVAQAQLWRALTRAAILRLDQRELDGAAELLSPALEVVEGRLEAPGAGAEGSQVVAELAETRGLLGLLELSRQDHANAVDHLTGALELLRELVEKSPSNATWRGRLQVTLNHLGSAHSHLGETQRALEVFAESIAVGTPLVREAPGNAWWARELALAHSETAWLLRQADDPLAALEHLERSLEISRELAARDPTDLWARADLAWDLLEMGRLRRELGGDWRQESHPHWQDALGLIETVTAAKDQPHALNTHAELLLELDELEAAWPILQRLAAEGWVGPDLGALMERRGIEAPSTDPPPG